MYSMYKQTDSDHLEKRAANLNLYKFRPQPKKWQIQLLYIKTLSLGPKALTFEKEELLLL
jgi:hypothetical protein